MFEKIGSGRPQVHGRMLAYKKIMRMTMELYDISRKQIAIAMGVDAGTVTRYLDDSYHLTIPIHALKAWRRETGDLSLLRQIADDHGYALVPNGDARETISPARLLPLLLKSFGEQMGSELEHRADGFLDDAERAEDIAGWTKIKQLIETHLDGLVASVSQRETGSL